LICLGLLRHEIATARKARLAMTLLLELAVV
jgi:hypothetical protein